MFSLTEPSDVPIDRPIIKGILLDHSYPTMFLKVSNSVLLPSWDPKPLVRTPRLEKNRRKDNRRKLSKEMKPRMRARRWYQVIKNPQRNPYNIKSESEGTSHLLPNFLSNHLHPHSVSPPMSTQKTTPAMVSKPHIS